MKKLLLNFTAILIALSALLLNGCANDAEVASQNLSYAADNFQIERRIIFINTWTDKYLLEIDGLCSIKNGSYNTGPRVWLSHARRVRHNTKSITSGSVVMSLIFRSRLVLPKLGSITTR